MACFSYLQSHKHICARVLNHECPNYAYELLRHRVPKQRQESAEKLRVYGAQLAGSCIFGITSQNYPGFQSVGQSDQAVEDGLGGKGDTTECSLLARLDLLGLFCYPFSFGWGLGIM